MKRRFLTLTAGQAAGSIASALAFVLVGRQAGVAGIAALGAVAGALSFVFVIADLGVATYLSKSRALGRSEDVAVALRLNVLSTIVFGTLAAAAVLWTTATAGWPLVLALLGVSLALEKNSDTALSVVIADGAVHLSAASVLMRRFTLLGVLVIFLALRWDVITGYAVGSLVSAALGQLVLRQWLRSRVSPMAIGIADLKRVLGQTWPYLLSNVTASVRQLDNAIVAWATSTATTGIYAAASRILQPFYLIPAALASLLVPHSARLTKQQARLTMMKLVGLFTVASVCALCISPFVKPLTRLVMGAQFTDSGPVFAVLLVSLPFVALSSPLGSILQSQGFERYVGYNGTIFAVLTVAMIGAGAFFEGAIGAALGLGLAYFGKCVSLTFKGLSALR
jgi:O-antigen/teichoic acid export membrane protein